MRDRQWATTAIRSISRLNPIFSNHHIYFMLSGVSAAFWIFERLFGHEYADFFTEICFFLLAGIGAVAFVVEDRTSPIDLPSSTRTLPILEIPTPAYQVNLGIEMVHNYFNPKGFSGFILGLLNHRTPIIREEVMQLAFQKNHFSAITIIDEHGAARGFVEIWSLRPDKLDDLLESRIDESSLEAADFPDYNPDLSHFYVAITVPEIHEGNATVPFWNPRTDFVCLAMHGTFRLIEEAYLQHRSKTSPNLHFYGVDETPRGRRMLRHLGFSVDEARTSARRKSDSRRSVYHLEVDAGVFKAIQRRLRRSMSPKYRVVTR